MSALKVGHLRYFRNGSSAPATIIYPDGLVRVVVEPPVEDGMAKVQYLDESSPLNVPFWAEQDELELAPEVEPRTENLVEDLWVVTVPGVPTFYLNGAIQGIVSRVHAAQVAASIIGEQASVGPSNIERLTDLVS